MPRVLFLLLHIGTFGCLGFPITTFSASWTTRKSTRTISSSCLFGMKIPIFPLRRTVRLPTESLTLNLYEERYLALAEYVLLSQYPFFGAIYSSEKPQIVRNGTGPIVPLFERGDVGVLFLVHDSEEALIPTRGGGIPRRRIRLVARGSVRFRIDDILQNGYDTSFILVNGSLYMDDDPPPTPTDEESKETTADQHVLGSQEELDWVRTTQTALNRHLDVPIHEHLLSVEMASFHRVAQTLSDGRPRERLKAIQCQNTQERLQQQISQKPLLTWWR